jgi:hypothetical protein
MSVSATYSNTTTFTVAGDQRVLFSVGRRVRASCGVDGYKYGTISSSTYGTSTTVVLATGSDALTANLTAVDVGVVGTSAAHALSSHGHAGIYDGGYLPNLRIASSSGALIEDNQASPSGTRPLGVGGYLYATRVYNAIWNDIADFQPCDDLIIYGRVYRSNGLGVRLCRKRCEEGVSGIASDTYGFGVGARTRAVPLCIGGWVLAFVDRSYLPGTPLVNDANAGLTRATLFERLFRQERIVAIYDRIELLKFIANKEERVAVNGRHWVKV